MSRRLGGVALLCVLGWMLGAPPALADQPSAFDQGSGEQGEGDEVKTAAKWFESGRNAFAEGRYEEAAQAFEHAAEVAPHPAPLINAGEAWEKAGDLVNAVRAFDRARRLDQASAEDKQDIAKRIERLRKSLGVIEIDGPEDVLVRIDTERWHGGDRVFVKPGKHIVTLADVEDARVKKVVLRKGGTRTVDVDKLQPGAAEEPDEEDEPAPVVAPPRKEAESDGISAPTVVAFGVALVAGGAATYFSLQVIDARDAYDAKPNREDFDRFNQNRTLTNVSVGIAVAGAGIGTILLIGDLDSEEPPEQRTGANRSKTRVGIAPAAQGAGLSLRGVF